MLTLDQIVKETTISSGVKLSVKEERKSNRFKKMLLLNSTLLKQPLKFKPNTTPISKKDKKMLISMKIKEDYLKYIQDKSSKNTE